MTAVIELPRLGGQTLKRSIAGTHRVVAPETTVARVQPLMEVMGITRIANITGLDVIGIPVVVVVRPNSRSLAVSQGKGLTLAAAKASALMESVEAYHAERITLPLKIGSLEELRYTHLMVDVAQLPTTRNSPFHPNLQLLWIAGRDLIEDETVWVPYELVHTQYTMHPRVGAGSFTATSNGLASGNHLLEAISHGICEVVERDATTLWSLLDPESADRTRLDLASVDDAGCREVIDKYERARVAAAVWETTSDVGIPSFLCMIRDESGDAMGALYSTIGMGCHPSRAIALLRALTEAAQSRLTAISGSRDDVVRNVYERSLNPDVLDREFSMMQVRGPLRHFRDGPDWDAPSFEEDVAWELERLHSAGIQRVIVTDLSKPEFGLPVVRVIIPGLEGVGTLTDYLPGSRARARQKARV
jgi:ribosomal protein S12 methylthiotransferase accessory factor